MLNQRDPDLQSWLNLDSAQQILNVRVEANSTGTEKFILQCKHILALIDKKIYENPVYQTKLYFSTALPASVLKIQLKCTYNACSANLIDH